MNSENNINFEVTFDGFKKIENKQMKSEDRY
jgi:hypothetical protein